jgi:hypothetical protein
MALANRPIEDQSCRIAMTRGISRIALAFRCVCVSPVAGTAGDPVSNNPLAKRIYLSAARAFGLCFGALLIAVSPSSAQTKAQQVSAETPQWLLPASETDPDAPCRIPFETLKDAKTNAPFPLSAVLNENETLPMNIRQRYIVADLNTADESGLCRGVREHFTPVTELSEFPLLRGMAAKRKSDVLTLAKEDLQTLLKSVQSPDDTAALMRELEDLKNYQEQVERYQSEPVIKARVFNHYCVGQTLNFCEIADGKPKLVYRFVTSSSRWLQKVNAYYAPINFISNRSWSSDRRYTPADARRDERMGGGSAHIAMFENGGNPIEMPNFMHFLPAAGYAGERANGIHQIAGGLDSGGTFGAPVSLGCIRLSKYQAKLARWWTPRQAKFFIYFEPNQYRNRGDAANGMARSFVMPPPLQTSARQDVFSPFRLWTR